MADNREHRPVVHTKKHLARVERERRQTRLILIGFIIIMIAAAALVVYGIIDESDYLRVRQPVAKVGDVEISGKDFQTRVQIQREGLINTYEQYYTYQQYGIDVSAQLQQMQSQLDNAEELGQLVLDAMINEELIRQEAAKRGITVTDQEVEDAIRAAEQYFPNGTPTSAPTGTAFVEPTNNPAVLEYITATPEATSTAAAFTATLEPTATLEGTPGAVLPEATSLTPLATATATLEPTATATLIPTATLSGSPTPEPTSTPYTLEGFQEQYQKKIEHFAKYNLTEAQYRDLFKTDLLRQKLYAQITADTPHTEEQVHARHILVATEAEALTIIEQLKNGADFGEIAAKRSQDTGSGAQGGDLGWFGHGAMVQPFEEAAFSLKVGEISQPVQSTFGFHVIQVIEKGERPLDESAYKQATDKAFDDFLAALRADYKVETFDVWKQIVPTTPSFASLATEAAQTANPR